VAGVDGVTAAAQGEAFAVVLVLTGAVSPEGREVGVCEVVVDILGAAS